MCFKVMSQEEHKEDEACLEVISKSWPRQGVLGRCQTRGEPRWLQRRPSDHATGSKSGHLAFRRLAYQVVAIRNQELIVPPVFQAFAKSIRHRPEIRSRAAARNSQWSLTAPRTAGARQLSFGGGNNPGDAVGLLAPQCCNDFFF